MGVTIWWIRRDLRIQDNPALARAFSYGSPIIPVYILDPFLLKKDAATRKNFLFNALKSLNSELMLKSSRLIIRAGDPLYELEKLFRELNADRIIAEADYSPYAKTRDHEVSKSLQCEFVPGLTILPPETVRKLNGNPYTVFTPYMRTWKSLPVIADRFSPKIFQSVSVSTNSLEIPEGSIDKFFPASSSEARVRLRTFLEENIFTYEQGRNRMDRDGTSGLSPYLRFGLISINTIASEVRNLIDMSTSDQDRENAETWLNELVWRDFYFSILDSFPHITRGAFRAELINIHWRDSPTEFESWKYGLTGYPAVDAGMRQLRETGWMHNRARMITASFLVKDLLINWQAGEAWFMENLIDGDLASNNGGWQWCAGTGTDAAPYFRIFNPVLQGKKFDPQGNYVRRWVPELSRVPAKYIHEPWKIPPDTQSNLGVDIGRTYPSPIVNHLEARERALAAYKFSKNTQ